MSAQGSRSDFRALLIAGSLAASGLVFVIWAFLWHKPWDASEVLYDVGLSLLVATSIALAIGNYVRSIERLEEMRRDELRQSLEESRLAQQALEKSLRRRWNDLDRQVDLLDRQMEQAVAAAQDAKETIDRFELEVKLEEVSENVRQMRMRLDPDYKHPNDEMVEEVMSRMEAIISEVRPQSE